MAGGVGIALGTAWTAHAVTASSLLRLADGRGADGGYSLEPAGLIVAAGVAGDVIAARAAGKTDDLPRHRPLADDALVRCYAIPSPPRCAVFHLYLPAPTRQKPQIPPLVT